MDSKPACAGSSLEQADIARKFCQKDFFLQAKLLRRSVSSGPIRGRVPT